MPVSADNAASSAWGKVGDTALLDCMRAVLAIKPPGPEQLLQHPAFVRLAALCLGRYGGGEKLALSLHQAGISELVSLTPDFSDPQWGEGFRVSVDLLEEAGVAVRFISAP